MVLTFKKNLVNAVSHSNIGKIKTVEIYGTDIKTAENIVKNLNLSQEQNLLSINKKNATDKLELFSSIKLLDLERDFPNTLKLYFQPADLDFIYQKKKKLYGLNKLGQYFSLIDNNQNANLIINLPIIKGDLTNSKEAIEDKRFTHLVSCLEKIPNEEKDFIDQLSEIVLSDEVTLYTAYNETMIKIKNNFNIEDLRRVRYSLLYAKSLNQKIKEIKIIDKRVKYTFEHL